MRTLDKSRHSVYSLIYHVILVVKYRKEILDEKDIRDFLKLTIERITGNHNSEILEIGCDSDHVHFLVRTNPKLKLTQYINTIKTISSREIRRNFPQVKEKLWGGPLWSPSYFLATTGNVSIDTLKRYLQSQNVT